MDVRARSIRLALVAALLLAPSLAEASDAAGAFKSSHETIVKLVDRGASDADLRKAIDAMLDYGWIAEASLGGADNYAKVCGTRCAEFEALLTELIRENYIRMVRKADEHPIEFVGQVEGRGGVHKVTTKMKVEKNGRERNVTVEYVMHHSGGAWQVRDIITDEVSLAKTYRHEFHKIAKGEGIDGIIERLEQKLEKLDADGYAGI
jgi:phospholipid transport system substrate-binding protein